MKLARIKTLLVGNPGALFVIVFQALILTCASLQSLSPSQVQANSQQNPLVEAVAISAYCSLVIGVVVEAWDFAKKKALGGASG